jgi:outer membrane protein OmpA-like peptidoglycan-associated protein
MKTLWYVSASVILSWNVKAQATQNSPVMVNLHVINELTGAPIDAVVTTSENNAVPKRSNGIYQVELNAGVEALVMVTREGYFDRQLKLDYESLKSSPNVEVKLQPGIPQLHITILNENNETLTSAIDLFTLDESSVVFSEEVEISPYTIDLEYNKVHVLQVRSPGYFSFKDTIDFKNVFDGRVRERKITLVPLKVGNKISLNNIYFKENEAALTPFAKIMLVELTHVLEQQRTLAIEIGAYTDDRGSDEYNLQLSEKRAMAVKKYLMEKGALEKQLTVRGYGEASPLAVNDTEENRALNRRVEFKILKIN